jgi:hypothetical protein
MSTWATSVGFVFRDITEPSFPLTIGFAYSEAADQALRMRIEDIAAELRSLIAR